MDYSILCGQAIGRNELRGVSAEIHSGGVLVSSFDREGPRGRGGVDSIGPEGRGLAA